jgi:1-acyl-sn-glycerol-3-phosphate acyltransferase
MPTTVAAGARRPRVERDVLETVTDLVRELGTTPPGGTVTLDHALDRDLGIGSLERVELLSRLEKAFGIGFPDAVMGEADTARDLVAAVLAGQPVIAEAPPERGPVLVPAAAPPVSARTLTEVLRWHAEASPERPHVFLRTEDGREQAISYGALWTRAASVASGLREHGIDAGESVALMLRTEEPFFSAFFGVLLAGAVPVPIYPPFRPDRLEEYATRQVGILRNAEARLLLTFREAERVATLLRARVPSLEAVTAIDRIAGSGAIGELPRSAPGAPALIQYTSGSTGEPKGVLLTHANILANIRAFGQALAIRPDDVGVSWLPLYHDMGLIGSWLGSLYHGIPVVILSPLAFLARPARWLRAIAAHRGTLSPAPNFAFDLCVRKITDEEIEGVDLSSWRLAFNGSEAVNPETIERFTRRFAAYGFKPEAMCPVYGLAETAVALTVSPPGRPPTIDRVARERFERSRVAEPAAADEPNPLRFVACGRPIPGHEVRIVDAGGVPADERVEGRVEFRGPSVTRGYFRNPEITRAALHDGWMDSGDLGYKASGDLFITGRSKDIIIKAGRNLYPHEVEELVGGVPGVRKGCVAAFGVADPAIGTERLVVVAESRETVPDARERLRAAIVDRVVDALGIPPDAVVIAGPGTVLKTSSGKIRRGATRTAYLRGETDRRRPSARSQWLRLIARDLGARVRRLAASAGRLGFAVWVGFLLLLTLPALWAIVLALPAGRAVDRVVKRWSRLVLALSGCSLRVDGRENLQGLGAVILAANHSSYLDAVALMAAIPADFRFVAKRELTAAPLIRTVLRKVGHLTVERVDLSESVADARRAIAALRGGTPLLFFPEGTFVRAAGLRPFRLGAFKAAADARCPILPVTIQGTRGILPADTWLPRRGPIRVTIGKPLVPETDEWREIVRLRDRVRAEIARMLD